MRISRDIKEAVFRPKKRRLINLTNTELARLFELRAEAVRKELDGHDFWNNKYIVYWHTFQDLQAELFEVMMEIQSRYPHDEIMKYVNEGDFPSQCLPVKETGEIEL